MTAVRRCVGRGRGAALVGAIVAVLVVLAGLGPATPADGAEGSELQRRQWSLDQVRAPSAWTRTTGAGVTIAVIDTGVDLGHPDLAPRLVEGVTVFGCPDEPGGCGSGDWRDGEEQLGRLAGHGTHVAALAAGTAEDGVAGVAPSARILPIKAVSSELGGTVDEVAAGVRAASARGADVINLSLGLLPGLGQLTGFTGGLGPLDDAIAEASDAGAVVVVAAGNETIGPCAEPAFASNGVCVVATDRAEAPATYSNLGLDLGLSAVAAPGGAGTGGAGCSEEVLSAWPRAESGPCRDEEIAPSHAAISGTSMAAPHVAGTAALLASQGRSASEIVAVLQDTARTPGLGTGVFTPAYGHGIVDATAAVDTAVGAAGDAVRRAAGRDRVATAAIASRQTFADADTAVLARADDFADALAGGPLAADLDGPLLLTAGDRLSAAAGRELDRLGVDDVVLLGGESALSPAVAADARDRGWAVSRLDGADRFATAAAVAEAVGGANGMLVARGAAADPSRAWPDALSAAALGSLDARPVVLATRDRLPSATAAALEGAETATLVGGTAALSPEVEAAVAARAGAVERLSGADRYATSAAVLAAAEEAGADPATTWVATGTDFADALVAGAAAGSDGGVLALIDGAGLDRSPASRAAIADRAEMIEQLVLAGGPAAISHATEAELRALVE